MTTTRQQNGGYYAIKGFTYQFDKSLLEVLANQSKQIEIEQIQDIGIEGFYIQVKYKETQYFGNVPEIAWNFYIGGYQPAQKWLKDRQGRTLSNEDIEHYQKMIVSLAETKRIMNKISQI